MEVYKDWFYYLGDINDSCDKFYRVRVDGTCKERLVDDEIEQFIIKDNWIYCVIRDYDEDRV